MSLEILLTMAGISVGSALTEKILGKLGKIDEANMMSQVTTCMLISTVVGSILTAFGNIRKLK